MKKYVSIISIILLVLFLVSGCAKQDIMTWQEQYDLGSKYLSEENYEEAILCFTTAIEIDEKNTLAYISRAQTYALENQVENAISDYETVIELDSTEVEAYKGIADIYYSQNNYEKANEILEKALDKVDVSRDELYQGKVVTVYSISEEKVINLSELDDYLSDGWYDEPVCTMYSADGRTRITLESEVEAYKNVGWYTEPVKVEPKPVLYLNASASDSDFIAFANKNHETLRTVYDQIIFGAYFKCSDDFLDGKGRLVEDERASTMEDVKNLWYAYFSKSSDTLWEYREVNGKLYSTNAGSGLPQIGTPNYTKVNRISDSRIEITGATVFEDPAGEDDNYTMETTIVMVLENNIWMCESIGEDLENA